MDGYGIDMRQWRANPWCVCVFRVRRTTRYITAYNFCTFTMSSLGGRNETMLIFIITFHVELNITT